jgi:type IV secretion system protein VirB6
MGFFAQFFSWLNTQLSTYISANTAIVAHQIEPLADISAVIYILIWGYMCLAGKTQELVFDGVKRILIITLILGVGIKLWLFSSLVTDTFYNAPDQLAAGIIGAPNTVSIIDQVWLNGNLIAEQLLNKGSILSGDIAYYLAGFAVYVLVGLTAVYTAFLLALSKVALAVIIALGPLFIVFLFFNSTKRFFEAWVAQLANYALITLLALLVSALMLTIVNAYSSAAVANGGGITIAETARLCVASFLVYLVMKQVPSIAAGLASGVALSTFNAVESFLSWGLGGMARTGYQFVRGMIDGMRREPVSHWDSMRRGAGNLAGRGLRSAYDAARGQNRQGGRLAPRERIMPKHPKF